MVTVDAAAPAWAQRFAGAVAAALAAIRSELRRQPLRPVEFTSGELPDAARSPGALIAVRNGGIIEPWWSDGAAWRKMTTNV